MWATNKPVSFDNSGYMIEIKEQYHENPQFMSEWNHFMCSNSVKSSYEIYGESSDCIFFVLTDDIKKNGCIIHNDKCTHGIHKSKLKNVNTHIN